MDPTERLVVIEAITAIHEISVRALMKVFNSEVPIMANLIAPLTHQAASRVPPPFSIAHTTNGQQQRRALKNKTAGQEDGAGLLATDDLEMDEGEDESTLGEQSHAATVQDAGMQQHYYQPLPVVTPQSRISISGGVASVLPVKWSKACSGFIEWLYPERVKAVSTAYAYSHALGELIEQFKRDQTNRFHGEHELKEFVRTNDAGLRAFLPFPAKRPPRSRTAYRAFYLYMTGEDLWWDEGPLFTPQPNPPGGSVGSGEGAGGKKPIRGTRPKAKHRFMGDGMGELSEANLARLVETVGREREFTDQGMRLLKKLSQLDTEGKLYRYRPGENPEYDQRVRRVMTILRIKTKLKKGIYNGSYELISRDIQLIFDNTTSFYGAGHPLTVLVETKLRPCFNEWAEKVEQKQQAAAAAAAASPATVPETQDEASRAASEAGQQQQAMVVTTTDDDETTVHSHDTTMMHHQHQHMEHHHMHHQHHQPPPEQQQHQAMPEHHHHHQDHQQHAPQEHHHHHHQEQQHHHHHHQPTPEQQQQHVMVEQDYHHQQHHHLHHHQQVQAEMMMQQQPHDPSLAPEQPQLQHMQPQQQDPNSVQVMEAMSANLPI